MPKPDIKRTERPLNLILCYSWNYKVIRSHFRTWVVCPHPTSVKLFQKKSSSAWKPLISSHSFCWASSKGLVLVTILVLPHTGSFLWHLPLTATLHTVHLFPDTFCCNKQTQPFLIYILEGICCMYSISSFLKAENETCPQHLNRGFKSLHMVWALGYRSSWEERPPVMWHRFLWCVIPAIFSLKTFTSPWLH